MTLQSISILVGIGTTTVLLIAHAAIAWWRIGAIAQTVAENERAMWEKFSDYDQKFEQAAAARGRAEAERESLFRRLSDHDHGGDR